MSHDDDTPKRGAPRGGTNVSRLKPVAVWAR